MSRYSRSTKDSFFDFIEKRKTSAREYVNSLSGQELESDLEEIMELVCSLFSLPIQVLHWDRLEATEHGNKRITVSPHDPRFIFDPSERGPLMVDGQFYKFSVPITGSEEVLGYLDTRIIGRVVSLQISAKELFVTLEDADLTDSLLESLLESLKRNLLVDVQNINNGVRAFNRFLEEDIRKILEKRQEQQEKRKSALQKLGIQLKRRESTPEVINEPKTRKELVVQTNVSDSDGGMKNSDFENILRICSNMSKVMEFSPRAFSQLDEEDIRFHFLVQLNGVYDGQAAGETFNFEGKSDILVRVGLDNIFIAECKFWNGSKKFAETIDQLTRYVSWRDTKTAVFIFNRKSETTSVVAKVNAEIRRHELFLRELEEYRQDASSRYLFRNKSDSQREFTLSVMVFDVPN